jgi:hypothetical protein
MYIEVPIIGSGTKEDPYRASVAVPRSCLIPSNPDGSPKFATTLVWVPDKYDKDVDPRITRIPLAEGRVLAKQMDPNANLDKMEQKRDIHTVRDISVHRD